MSYGRAGAWADRLVGWEDQAFACGWQRTMLREEIEVLLTTTVALVRGTWHRMGACVMGGEWDQGLGPK